MHIQQATIEDVEAVASLENALFDNAFGEGTIRREIAAGYCAIARFGLDVVGYVLVRPHPELHDLLRLGVLPAFQGQGLGQRLLTHVLERFPGTMMLMVRKENPALRLYRRAGFSITGDAKIAWVMKRVSPTSE